MVKVTVPQADQHPATAPHAATAVPRAATSHPLTRWRSRPRKQPARRRIRRFRTAAPTNPAHSSGLETEAARYRSSSMSAPFTARETHSIMNWFPARSSSVRKLSRWST